MDIAELEYNPDFVAPTPEAEPKKPNVNT
jgi:hypothetical protein